MHRRHVLLLAVTVLAVLGGAWALLGSYDRGDGPPASVSDHPTQIPDAVRTVTVSLEMPRPSAHARRLSAMLEEGTMPRNSMMAEVLTDTDCAPDERMISRCRNEMRLPDGQRMVLRHPHDMSSIPCLAPGERVLLVPASA